MSDLGYVDGKDLLIESRSATIAMSMKPGSAATVRTRSQEERK
jgi:hypothetical protein